MNWYASECKSGDMIRISIGSFFHYGIFVSEDEVIEFGEPPIDNLLSRDSGTVKVISATIDEFSCGRTVEVAHLDAQEKQARLKPKDTVRRARARIGEGGYNLIHNNCEHFANECVFGEKRSSTIDEAREKWRTILKK